MMRVALLTMNHHDHAAGLEVIPRCRSFASVVIGAGSVLDPETCRATS